MPSAKNLNLGIKVNGGKQAEDTFKSVTGQMYKLRKEVSGTKDGTKEWEKANRDLAKVEQKRDGMIAKQKAFREEVKKTTSDTTDNQKAMQEFGASSNKVMSSLMSGDLIGVQEGLRGMQAGIWGATKAAVAFIATPLGMILAGLALAIAAVTSYFRDSEEGQNAWNKIAAVTGVIVGNLTDLLSDLGKMLFDTFSDPKKALTELSESIKTNIENRVIGLIQFFPRLGEAISLALSGKFKEASLVAADAVGQIATGVEGVTEKITGSFDKAGNAVQKFGQEVKDEVKRAAELADLEAKADKIERGLIVERGKVEAQVAEARLKARDEDNISAADRKKALDEAVAAQNGLMDKEIEAAEIRRKIKAEQNSFSKSNKADLDEEATLTAKVDQLRRKKSEDERSMVRDQIRLKGELKKAGGGSGGGGEAAEEKKRLDALDALEAEYSKKSEDREANSALKKAILEKERAVKKAEELGASKQLMDDINAAHDIKIQEEKTAEEKVELERLRAFDEKKRTLENELELAKATSDEEKAAIKAEQDLEKEELAYEKKIEDFQLEMERLQLNDEEKNAVLESLKEAHENVILGIQKKATDEKIADEERLQEAKRQLWNDSLNAAINLAGAETKVGQALLIAKQIMAARETAMQLGLFANKMALNVGEATGAAATGAAETAKVGFPQNIPLLIGFAAQMVGIISAVKGAAKAKSQVKTPTFARGGYTDLFGMGYKDSTGHEVAGDVHVGEYVVPKIVREDPEVPQILNYLEGKRKKALGLYANGGDTLEKNSTGNPMSSGSSDTNNLLIGMIGRLISKLDEPIVVDNYFGFEAEEKRQKTQRTLEKLKQKTQIKS